MDTSSLISVLSLAVALTALIIAPYFTHRQAVTQMRQAWINSLRDSVAEFLSLASLPHLAFGFRWSGGAEIPPDLYGKLMLLDKKIELLLNRGTESHRTLIVAVHQLVELIHTRQRDLGNRQFYERKYEFENLITSVTQDIIRYEWIRTKRFI